MKTISGYIKKALVLCCLFAGFALQGYAQWDIRKTDLIVDWQMHAPFSTGFADKISGWGMNFELTYDVAPRWAVGAFASFHTNHKYVGRETLQLSPTESLTTDQQRSAFQLPFGVTASYTLYEGRYVKPYVGAKAGALFVRDKTYFGTGGLYDKSWGFYVSPEIGLKIYPTPRKNWGIHLAAYYSYGTNRTQTLTTAIDGQNGLGFRVGIIF